MKSLTSQQRIAIASLAILLLLFLVRPGVSHLKSKIALVISRAVARPVEIGSVHLRFLPPGFDLNNVVVEEDPAFGAEPMLRAPEVTAAIRITSLFRGRLDISRLELTDPSLNLVRRADGHWNWESLLERAARTPLAPTAKSKAEPRLGFPYIEGSSGRINFKAGPEKKPYALLNADFALWQDSENAWGLRLEAQPMRIDASLNDAGVLRLNGTWQRAATLRETPLQFNIEWNRAQLGQVTRFISGEDKGWRGELSFNAALNGTPAALQISADSSIAGFHRYDISSAGGVRLYAHCDAQYNSPDHLARQVFCSAPVGSGMMTLHGDAGFPALRTVNLSLDLENVPAAALAQLALRAKKDLPPDLAATGTIQGNFDLRRAEAQSLPSSFQGRGEITDLRLQSPASKVELPLGTVPFLLLTPGSKTKSRPPDSFAQLANESRLEFGPFPLPLSHASPAQVRGWIARSGFDLEIRGEGEISRTLRLAGLAGIPAIKANVEGAAQIDLAVSGAWSGHASTVSSPFAPPQVTGKVLLRNVRASLRGVNGPIEIASAELQLSADGSRVEKINAHAGGSRWTGSLTVPRNCESTETCLVHFTLNSDQASLAGLHELLRAPRSDRRWYQVLSPAEPAPATFLQKLRAEGQINIARLSIHDVIANRVSASLDLDRATLKIADLHADLFGGKYSGDWQIAFASGPPACTSSGMLTSVSLDQIAAVMNDHWISGTGSGAFQLKSAAADFSAFWHSAEADLRFDLRDVSLSHIALNSGDPPLEIPRWQAQAHLRNGAIEIENARLVAPSGSYEIGGTVSLEQALDFKLSQAAAQPARIRAANYSITGTLAEPRIELSLSPQTQAQLKP